MMHRFLRIALAALLTAVCIAMLGGCMMPYVLDEMYDDGGGYASFTDMRESISDGYFKLTIHTNKDTFAQGEPIDCEAELTYIGDQDSITVYVYGDPITMDMTGKDTWYESTNHAYQEDTLVLKKGEPIRCTLTECLPKSASVLPGKYEIDAYAGFGLSPDGAVSYNGYVSAVIVVVED
jgi:hypothetical protein